MNSFAAILRGAMCVAGLSLPVVPFAASSSVSETSKNMADINPLIQPNWKSVPRKRIGDRLEGSEASEPTYKAVPSSRIARAAGFTTLFIKLGWDRLVGNAQPVSPEDADNPLSVLSPQSHELVVQTLCKMRGAVLKLGQMLSLQDEHVVPSTLLSMFSRVRDSAVAMPPSQLHSSLAQSYGENWREKFVRFDETPIAAASIGQVHHAKILDADTKNEVDVAVKVQYPGVSKSIDSDIANLKLLMKVSMVPPGLFIGSVLEDLKQELKYECDYEREAANQEKYTECLASHPIKAFFHVPKVHRAMCTSNVLVTEFVDGISVDQASKIPSQAFRDALGERLLRLTLVELFEWKFMQTDPNYSNFFVDPVTGVIHLIDFGAVRTFDPDFVRMYLDMVHATVVEDREKVIELSIKLGFLTGQEMKEMIDAHVASVMLVGRPFRVSDRQFDFEAENIPAEVKPLIPIMLRLRLRPPPAIVYSLHRKLTGTILLCTKLHSKVNCSEMFWDTYHRVAKELLQPKNQPVTEPEQGTPAKPAADPLAAPATPLVFSGEA